MAGVGLPHTMDQSRHFDLEQLSQMLQENWRSKAAKREIEQTMDKIINTSTSITSLRERLIRATRGGDTHEIRKIQMHIQNVRQQETNGREF